MADFIDLALQYPTAVFSVLLVAVLIYWCFVILGAVDIDALDLDVDLDLDTDVDLDVDVDADVGHKAVSFLDLLVKLNLSEVPLTVSLSMVVLSSWVLSMVTVEWLGPVASSLLVATGVGMMVMKFYRKVEQGKALIVNKMRTEPEVTFTGAKVVLPIVHKAEVMDISVKTIEIDRRGKEGLICQDNIRADVKVVFFVRVNKTKEDVIRVAQAIGCERASDKRHLDELFSAKFSEALKTVGKQLDFVGALHPARTSSAIRSSRSSGAT